MTLPKRQKQLLSRSIVHAVRSQNPPGRFLQRDAQSDLWYDVGDARATEKTSQALREGAPKLRNKLKKEDGGSDDGEEFVESKPEASKKKASTKPPPIVPQIIVPPPPVSSQPNVQKAANARAKPAETDITTMPPPAAPEPAMAHLSSNGQQYDSFPSNDGMPPPPTPLDPAGDFSFGTISVPEAPDLGLENGFSFGSVMSVDQHRSSMRSSAGYANMPTGLQGQEFSMGSLNMSDAEQKRLESHLRGSGVFPQGIMPATIQEGQGHEEPAAQPVDFGLERGGLSAGSIMSIGTIQSFAMDQIDPQHRKPPVVSFGGKTVVPPEIREGDDQEAAPEPVDFGLEHAGLSAGSMMSIGTLKLEDVGTSFGSVMSFATKGDMPGAVDGGLEDIGTSFGSMTIGGGAPPPPPRPATFAPPEPLDAAEPTLLHQQRSTANLLDFGDSDSEDERRSEQASLQKSADWQKLKATFEAQQQSGGYPSADMPPSLSGFGNHVDMPPPAARNDEWRNYEASMLNRGDSLAGEDFDVPKQSEDRR